MSEIDTGGPAFPVPTLHCGSGNARIDYPPHVAGMTLRDWFAGQALAGLLSEKGDEPHTAVSGREWAAQAYRLADAMIEYRKLK